MSQLSISLIQTELFWEDKQANMQMLEQKIKGIKQKTELVVLPEMFSTGFTMKPAQVAEDMSGETIAWMKRVAKEKKIILTGSMVAKEGDHYYNRMIWMLPTGDFGYYDKRHRFAFAGEDKEFSAGSKRLIASVKGWRVNLQICYDLRFPVWARQQGQENELEYDLLIYVANWPEKRSNAWKTLLPARAIENQCYVIGVNRTGIDGNGHQYAGDSMIVDPLGRILDEQSGSEAILNITLDKKELEDVRNKFPFWKDADEFMIGGDVGEG